MTSPMTGMVYNSSDQAALGLSQCGVAWGATSLTGVRQEFVTLFTFACHIMTLTCSDNKTKLNSSQRLDYR